MNPFTLDAGGHPFPLDMRGELDDTAAFRSHKKWGPAIEFPLPFGRSPTEAEASVAAADAATGASLKLSILNPHGRVWTMVAGGGASVIYADTVGDLGAASELGGRKRGEGRENGSASFARPPAHHAAPPSPGNYAEYSGAPSRAETYAYAKTLLRVATAAADGQPRALLVGGGIANFTDVAATFAGIIQAMQEAAEDLKRANVKIYVRRGGPNYKAGLDAMRAAGAAAGLDVAVCGPEATMTGICRDAIAWVRGQAA